MIEIIEKDGRRWRRVFYKVGETWEDGLVFEGVDEESNKITGLVPIKDDLDA